MEDDAGSRSSTPRSGTVSSPRASRSHPDEKVEIALALERLGVDVIEAGFAFSSPGDFEGVRAVGAAVTAADGLRRSHGRARRISTPPSKRSRDARGRTRIHVVLATSPIHMEHKLGSSRPRSSSRRPARGRVRRADASTRSSSAARTRLAPTPAFVAEASRVAIEAGATTINLPDTVGYTLPEEHCGVPPARFAGSAPSSSM